MAIFGLYLRSFLLYSGKSLCGTHPGEDVAGVQFPAFFLGPVGDDTFLKLDVQFFGLFLGDIVQK
jgi:hypothetical protein